MRNDDNYQGIVLVCDGYCSRYAVLDDTNEDRSCSIFSLCDISVTDAWFSRASYATTVLETIDTPPRLVYSINISLSHLPPPVVYSVLFVLLLSRPPAAPPQALPDFFGSSRRNRDDKDPPVLWPWQSIVHSRANSKVTRLQVYMVCWYCYCV